LKGRSHGDLLNALLEVGNVLFLGGGFIGSRDNTQNAFEPVKILEVRDYVHQWDAIPVLVQRGLAYAEHLASSPNQWVVADDPATNHGGSIPWEFSVASGLLQIFVPQVGAPGYAMLGSGRGIPFDSQIAYVPKPDAWRGQFDDPEPTDLPTPAVTESFVFGSFISSGGAHTHAAIAVVARGVGSRCKLAMKRHDRAPVWDLGDDFIRTADEWGYEPTTSNTPADVVSPDPPGSFDYMDFHLCQSWGIYLNDTFLEYPPDSGDLTDELGMIDGARIDDAAGLGADSASVYAYVDASARSTRAAVYGYADPTEGVYIDGYHYFKQGHVAAGANYGDGDTTETGDDETQDAWIAFDGELGTRPLEWDVPAP
jgi:hypothetical protein